MSFNAAERKDVRKAEKDAKIAERQRHETVAGIMSVMPGRAWIADKLEECHVFASSFSTDPLQMAFHEGERNIGLRLLNDIMAACPNQYVVMMQERNTKDAARDRYSRDPEDTDGGDSPADAGDADADGDPRGLD